MGDQTLCIVFCTPVPGHEQQLVDWYDRRLAEILQVEGWVAGQRYTFHSRPANHGEVDQQWSQMLIYEIEGDAEAAFERLDTQMSAGRAPQDMLQDGHANWLFVPATERRAPDSGSGAPVSHDR